jgi:hypothetical protein
MATDEELPGDELRIRETTVNFWFSSFNSNKNAGPAAKPSGGDRGVAIHGGVCIDATPSAPFLLREPGGD